MVKRISSTAAAVLLLCSTALPASATAPPRAAAAAVELPFSPPLGRTIRYRHTQAMEGSGRSSSLSMTYGYRFDKAGDGFRLTVTALPEGASGTPVTGVPAPMTDSMIEVLKLPLILKLAADGEFQELENQAEYAAAVDRLFETTMKLVPANAPAEQKAMAKTVAEMVRSVPMESRVAKFVESVQPILEFGGTALTPGETLRTEMEVEGMGGAPLIRNVTIRLERVDAGAAHYTMVNTVPPEQYTGMIRKFFASLAASAPAVAAEAGEVSRASSEQRGTYRVSTADGLLQSYRSVETTEIVTAKETTRKIVTRAIDRAD